DTPAASAAPATQAAPAAAPAVVDTTPKEPDPVAPWVEAANSRRKIPFWALPVLIGLIPWAAMYMLTLDPPTPKELGPLDAGAEVYSTKGCSGCHGATGQGSGANPALTGDTGVAEVFTSPGSQVAWVAVGSSGFANAGLKTYGDADIKRPINGGMPAWGDSLTPDELMDVVLHERTTIDSEEFDIEKWKTNFEEDLSAHLPADKVEAFKAVLDKWEANPPA
ncbi:MAG: cytochrome c, partial [Microthrixaceae bacterium]